jgi:hypothetical protein
MDRIISLKQRIAVSVVVILLFLLTTVSIVTAQNGKPAQYPRILSEGGDHVVAFDSACRWSLFVQALRGEFKDKAKDGMYVYRDGRTVDGCYVEVSDNLIFMFKDGDRYQIPAEEFTRKPLPRPGQPEVRI